MEARIQTLKLKKEEEKRANEFISIIQLDLYKKPIELTLFSGEQIEDCAFIGKKYLIRVNRFPARMTKIGTSSFKNCVALTSIAEIPVTCISLGENVFMDNISLVSCPNLPPGLTEIKKNTFRNCKSMVLEEGFQFPTGLNSIGEDSFRETAIRFLPPLPKKTLILEGAFRGCQKLLTVANFPARLKIISAYSFCHCRRLTELPSFPEKLNTM